MSAAPDGVFFHCDEDSGLPKRLVGESDVFSLPATEEFVFEAPGFERRAGSRARLTTHRLCWWAAAERRWLAVRLDGLDKAEASKAFMRAWRCVLSLRSGSSVAVKCSEEGRAEELARQVQAAVQAARWRDGSYDYAAAGGLQRLLGTRDARQQASDETLDVALTDLSSLKQHAAQTAAIARRAAAAAAAQARAQQQSNPSGSGDPSGVKELLEDFGLLNPDGSLVAKGGAGRADVAADVGRVCEAALARRGGLGLLLAHDVFCLVNRARGTALVSPGEVMAALRACAAPGGRLRLRSLGSTGALAVCLARSSDEELDGQLLQLVAAGASAGAAGDARPLSAFRLAQELGLTAAEAQYLLRDVEARAVLVRDDAPEGVFYYRNFFADY